MVFYFLKIIFYYKLKNRNVHDFPLRKFLIFLLRIYSDSFGLYWPAHPDDPQGIRVASVIEFSVCVFVYSKQIF